MANNDENGETSRDPFPIKLRDMDSCGVTTLVNQAYVDTLTEHHEANRPRLEEAFGFSLAPNQAKPALSEIAAGSASKITAADPKKNERI